MSLNKVTLFPHPISSPALVATSNNFVNPGGWVSLNPQPLPPRIFAPGAGFGI